MAAVDVVCDPGCEATQSYDLPDGYTGPQVWECYSCGARHTGYYVDGAPGSPPEGAAPPAVDGEVHVVDTEVGSGTTTEQ